MELNLTKPIAFIDLETTGVNVTTDRIVEISIIKISPGEKTEIRTERINPTIPIPSKVTDIHGITDEDVKDKPNFSEIALSLSQFIDNSDLAGYNSNKFDIPMLVEEFLRAEVDFEITGRKLVDVQNIFHKMEPRNLSAAYKFYCKKKLEGAHSAEADAMATYEILKAQLDKYNKTPFENKDGEISYPVKNDMAALSEFSYHTRTADLIGHIIYDENDIEVFNFGKYKGKSVQDVFKTEPQYYNWMMKSQFPHYTKKVITAIYLRGFNKNSVNLK